MTLYVTMLISWMQKQFSNISKIISLFLNVLIDFERKWDRGLCNSGALHAWRLCQTDQQHWKERQQFPSHRICPRLWTLYLLVLWRPGSCCGPTRCVWVIINDITSQMILQRFTVWFLLSYHKELPDMCLLIFEHLSSFNFFTGWVTANGKGLTYLTDPQIHSTKTPKGPSNLAARGLRYFLEEQHGPKCNGICQRLNLPPFFQQTHVLPQKPWFSNQCSVVLFQIWALTGFSWNILDYN